MPDYPQTLVIHGGAGTILPQHLTPELEKQYHAGLRQALEIGAEMLQRGKKALEVVEATVEALENFPLFNAGKGAVFTHQGTHELDAAIMDGHTGKAGAVAGIRYSANPIKVARAVMERTEHILLSGTGAEDFAVANGFPKVENSYFDTEQRRKQWEKAVKEDKILLDHDGKPTKSGEGKFGTVGAVALDNYGHLAAATSTGGMTNKKFGRVGDSPLIGAGTYADSNCAISATGHGEVFIQHVVAYDIAAMIKYRKMSLREAAQKCIMEKLGNLHPDSGGIIAVGKDGAPVMVFNSAGMYRGFWRSNGEIYTGIYK